MDDDIEYGDGEYDDVNQNVGINLGAQGPPDESDDELLDFFANQSKCNRKNVLQSDDEDNETDATDPPGTPKTSKKPNNENCLSADSEATVPANNKDNTKATPRAKKQLLLTSKIKKNHQIIYSLKLRIPQSKDPLKSMQIVLREWFTQMKKCAPSFVVYK